MDLNTDAVHFHGKGSKDRRVRVGPRTARAVSRHSFACQWKRVGGDTGGLLALIVRVRVFLAPAGSPRSAPLRLGWST
ncbi:hypothetical protein OG607_37660 [Streptomyces sp. NBC_01537]|uniref:hypothetical protein n=1 Tax=Streptomyces sp. NBC_01537 TaxID=2903896 RepID=UPI0038688AFB